MVQARRLKELEVENARLWVALIDITLQKVELVFIFL